MAKRTKAEALKTRQELIETAIAQFAQHGVSKTTLAPLIHDHVGAAVLLSQSLELCHIGGNSLLTLCRVENVNDLIVGQCPQE